MLTDTSYLKGNESVSLPPFVVEDVARALAQLRAIKAQRGGMLCGIFLTEHVGDIVACEPVIRHARSQHPDAVLVWVTRSTYAPLVAHHPLLDAVVTVASLASVNPLIRSGIFYYSIDLNVHGKPTGIPGLLHEKIVGSREIDTNSYVAWAPLLRAFSIGAGLPALDEAPTLYISAEADAKAACIARGEPFVVVHTVANDARRSWPISNWRTLTEHILMRTRYLVYEVGLRSTIRRQHARFRSLAGELSLLETAAVIKNATCFFGVESGPAHIANALQVNSLVLAGQFLDTDFFPYTGYFAETRERSVLLHSSSVAELPIGTALAHPQTQRILHDHAHDC